MLINSSIFPALSCTSFKVSDLILRSLIHFELICVQSERHGSSFSFLHADIQFSSNIYWKGCLFSIVCFRYLCQKSGGHSRMHSYLSLLFYATAFHICFYATTMLFLLLYLYSTVWSQVLWHVQCCSERWFLSDQCVLP
jgi:amino acid permease